MTNTETQSILVVGSGMSGLTAAIEAAEAGYDTYIVEKNPYLGGRVAQLHHYFPKLCPPYCGLEINFRRIKQNPRVRFFTLAEVEKISGEEGDFDVTIRLSPRYVNEKCTGCGKCADVCTMEIENAFNYGMDKIKAAYGILIENAVPAQNNVLDTLHKLHQEQSEAIRSIAQTIEQQYHEKSELFVILAFLTLALTLTIAFFVSRVISRGEKKLYIEKELAQVTLQFIGDGVITTDNRGLIRTINPVAEEYIVRVFPPDRNAIPSVPVDNIVPDSTVGDIVAKEKANVTIIMYRAALNGQPR